MLNTKTEDFEVSIDGKNYLITNWRIDTDKGQLLWDVQKDAKDKEDLTEEESEKIKAFFQKMIDDIMPDMK